VKVRFVGEEVPSRDGPEYVVAFELSNDQFADTSLSDSLPYDG
jgi:hypothetical protein